MSDEEVVEGEFSQELVPAGGVSVTLFRTDDPVEIVARATEVAEVLSEVLKKQGLTTRIGQKDYVNVEGWTLCGTMLGVFPVVEWTHKLDNGWEARVEARTKDGAIVGAAEAECLDTEKRWKSADDYAVRSMAQTRAISKALRAPLGFIVTLAGFSATPMEEITQEQPGPKAFDAETDLMEGGVTPKDAARVLVEIDSNVEWGDVFSQLETDWRSLEGALRDDFWRRVANAATWMGNIAPAGTMPPITDDQIVAGFAFAFAGEVVEVIRKEPDKGLLTEEQQEQLGEMSDDVDWPGVAPE